MRKIICLIINIAMLFSLCANTSFASGENLWTQSGNDGVVEIENIQSIKGEATVFSAYGDENFEFSMEALEDGAYAMEFSMLMYDFNALRTLNVSGVDILKVEKDGKIISAGECIHDDAVVGDAAARCICVGDTIYTVSGNKIVSHSVTDCKQISELEF